MTDDDLQRNSLRSSKTLALDDSVAPLPSQPFPGRLNNKFMSARLDGLSANGIGQFRFDAETYHPWELKTPEVKKDMELTAEIESRRKGRCHSDVDGPDAFGAVTTRARASSSHQVRGRGHRAPHSSGDESMASSSVALAEPSQPMAKDQHTEEAPVLCYKGAPEHQLLEAAKVGDERAFGELVSRCVSQVRHRIFRIVRNREDAEDALQDSLLNAHLHLHQFRGSCTFSSWLHRIAINSSLMLLRKRKAHAVISSDRNEDDPTTWDAWDVPDHSPNAEQLYAKQQALEGLSRAVGRLPSSFRSVVDEFYERECSMQETADAIGISVAAAKSRLMRARLMLRLTLKKQRVSSGDL